MATTTTHPIRFRYDTKHKNKFIDQFGMEMGGVQQFRSDGMTMKIDPSINPYIYVYI